jgi:hypothetical protein
MGGIPSTCVVTTRKAVRYGSSNLAVEKCDKATTAASALSSNSPPRYRLEKANQG